MKEILLGKSLAQLRELCSHYGFPGFTAGQIADWLYKKKVTDIERMTNLSAANRRTLAEKAEIGRSAPLASQVSTDGTGKYLFATSQNKTIESVYIPEEDRATLCVSCQSGCRMGCGFCATGSQGFNHHLLPAEILNQYYSLPQSDNISNIVYMGMGEPMDNLDAVLLSLQAMTADWGFAWSPYRITVSTVGVIPAMRRFLDESLCHLAVSLHNPFSAERSELMPVERTYPIAEVVEVLRHYFRNGGGQRRVSFEYILMDGYNDTLSHAKAVAALLRGLPQCRVNLIAYHEVPGKPFRRTSPGRTLDFQRLLREAGIICTLRKSRGEDISAACGLLARTNNPKF